MTHHTEQLIRQDEFDRWLVPRLIIGTRIISGATVIGLLLWAVAL